MKKTYSIIVIFSFLFIAVLGIQTALAKTLYDDFSDNYLDNTKWKQRELVRQVIEGKLISKVANSLNSDDARNMTSFVDPSTINTIKCDISVNVATLDSGTNSESLARIDGRFYNAKNSGTERGDIWAGLNIGNRGNGLEAWWEVWEATDDNGNNWEEKGSGSFSIPGLSENKIYTVEIRYNGDNDFTFTVANVSKLFTGPGRQGAEFTKYKGLETLVTTEGGFGNGYISASFDNVYINDETSVYDDFTIAPLGRAKWKSLEIVREIDNDKVILTSHSDGDRENTRLNFTTISPYTEAIVTVKGSRIVDQGDRGIARIDGYFYNDTYGPDNHNEYEGNIWASIYLNYYGDGTMNAACFADRALDAEKTQFEDLFYRQFNLPIILNRAYKLSIRFTGNKLLFTCKDTVTGREDIFIYEITTQVYEPYDKELKLLSRTYGDSTGGHMVVEFDDVYVDIADPDAKYDATGKWESIGSNPWATSGCNLPNVDDASTITITQSNNEITMTAPGDKDVMMLNGDVFGESYYFNTMKEDGNETEIKYGTFTLSSETKGKGSISFIWTDGVDGCEAGFDITITKSSDDSNGDGSDSTAGGGGGGGCAIGILR